MESITLLPWLRMQDKNAMILSSHFPVYKKLESYDTPDTRRIDIF